MKSKLSTAIKKSKTTTFSRVFHLKKIDNFLGKSKLNFWTKNEDFEQCGRDGVFKSKTSAKMPKLRVALVNYRFIKIDILSDFTIFKSNSVYKIVHTT